LVENRRGDLLPGSAAVVRIPSGTRRAILLPTKALIHEGDLVGVRVLTGSGPELRWLRLGSGFRVPSSEPVARGTERRETMPGELVEALAGLAPGDVVLLGEP
jgi:hypothetical protein